MRSFIAPCSSSVNPLNFLPVAVVLLADFCVPFCAGFMKFYSFSEINYFSRVLSLRFNQLRWALVVGTARNRQSQHSPWESNPFPFEPLPAHPKHIRHAAKQRRRAQSEPLLLRRALQGLSIIEIHDRSDKKIKRCLPQLTLCSNLLK